MAKPLVQDYLVYHNLQELEDEHGVVARSNATFDKLSLNYDQIMVKNGDLLAEQCRGLVLRPSLSLNDKNLKTRTVGYTDLLAWPMNRFYNMGDFAGADVDWNDPELRVYEKLDGTMIVTYWDPLHQRWFAATRSVSEADLPIRTGHMEIGDATFSDLFFRALKETREESEGKKIDWQVGGFEHIVHLNKELTYVFELTSPFNRVVVKYDQPRVTLIAARHTATGEEVAIESLRLQHVNRPKVWSLKNPTALEAFVNSSDPAALEGAVVCDSLFRRLKVKNKAWVLSSKAKDLVTVSRRSALQSIIAGTVDDVLPLIEADIADELRRMQVALRDYLKRVDEQFMAWKEEAGTDRRRFAELVNLSDDWATPYFQLLDKKGQNALDWITSMQEAGRLSPRFLDSLLAKLGVETPVIPDEPSALNVGAPDK